MFAIQADLLRLGRELIPEAGAGDRFDFGYFSCPEIGSAVEVLHLDTARFPPPEAVVGASSWDSKAHAAARLGRTSGGG